MAFGKDKDAKVNESTAPATDEGTGEAPKTEAKAEIVIPEGFVKIGDFAAELTFERVQAKLKANEPLSFSDDYVSLNEVYGWINAGMPNGHFGEGKQGKRVNRVEALEWLKSYTPGKRGRQPLTDEGKVTNALAKAIEAAKKLGLDPEQLIAAVKANAS